MTLSQLFEFNKTSYMCHTNTLSRILLLSFSILLFNCASKTVQNTGVQVDADYAIVDVSVLPMTSEEVLDHQTVLIKDGKIIKIGKFTPTKITKIIN